MGDYSGICELRGVRPEGRGCTVLEGLARCAKKSRGPLELMCTGNGFDNIVDTAVSGNLTPPSGFGFVFRTRNSVTEYATRQGNYAVRGSN